VSSNVVALEEGTRIGCRSFYNYRCGEQLNMTMPLQITFHQMDTSPTVRDRIQERADKLEQIYDRITDCRVVVEAPHRHHHKGKLFSVAVEVNIPGSKLTSHRSPGQHHEHEDVYIALRDAFEAIERQIHDYLRKKSA
jgi:ribosomal subunit interface protein